MPKKPTFHQSIDLDKTVDRSADNAFYKSTSWRKTRAICLKSNPLCLSCLKQGKTTIATEAHHILDRRQYPDLALVLENLEATCHTCHLMKRAMNKGNE